MYKETAQSLSSVWSFACLNAFGLPGSQLHEIVCRKARVVNQKAKFGSSWAGTIQDTLERLAELYGVEGQPEVQLRALMGSAMLLGEGKDRLQRIARAPGAVKSLAAIIGRGTDPDCKALASQIFAALVSSFCALCSALRISILLQDLHGLLEQPAVGIGRALGSALYWGLVRLPLCEEPTI